MVASLLTVALMGITAVTAAPAPALSTTQKMFLMEDMRQGVDSFVANYPPAASEFLNRVVTDSSRANACERNYVIFARGTFEPGSTKNLGMMVGIPFIGALKTAMMGDLESIGVDYSNDVSGYLSGGSTAGSQTMAKMITDKASQCPQTKIIVGGYSQGAQLAHNAMKIIPENVRSHVAGVAVFGDPYKDKAIPGLRTDQISTNCATDDPICKGIPIPLGSHLQYASVLTKTVDDIVAILKTGKRRL